MAIYVIIPVYNRLEETSRSLECLRDQILDEPLQIVVINDGSTDGTSEYLATQMGIVVLEGDGTLWWGGAMELGLAYVMRKSSPTDWVLMVNNDASFNTNFVQALIDTARHHSPAAVGSVICDEKKPHVLLSIGGLVDSWQFYVCDKLKSSRDRFALSEPHVVDVLSGRGTLYPISSFYRAGTMRPKWLPHYFADYELAVRVKRAGYRLLVCESAVTFTTTEFGNLYKPVGWVDRFFSVRSPYYLPATFLFWWACSSWFGRVTLLPRLLYYVGLKRGERRSKNS